MRHLSHTYAQNVVPVCAADGETYREALANMEIIIQEWIETAKELGRPIPAPRGRLAFA